MAKRLITRAQLSRLAQVSKPAITKRCSKDLAAACEGDRVDLDHPAVQEFLRSKGVTPPAPARGPTKAQKAAAAAVSAPPAAEADGSARRRSPTGSGPGSGEPPEGWSFDEGSDEDLAELTERLQPLLERFGNEQGFKDWLSALKDREIIREKRLKNEETETTLINREFVTVHLLSFIEETNKRLLTDMPKTLARRLYALKSSGGSTEEAERELRAAVSSQLSAVNKKLSKTLRDVAKRAAEKNAGGNGGPGAVAGRADRSSDD